MATSFNFKPESARTYATRENAIKAVEKRYPAGGSFGGSDLQYLICTNDEGRFFPVFIGERALQAMVHFHFSVVA